MIKKIIATSMLLAVSQVTNFMLVLPAHAQVKKCQDAQGKWHYGNDLSKVCKTADVKSIRESVKTGSSGQGESASDKELTRLELKVLNQTEYLTSDLKKILTPYNSVEDVESRFDRLKSNTETDIQQKTEVLDGLQQKQNALQSDQSANPDKNKVLLADINLRIKSTEADLRQLNVKSSQIDQRRAKVILLFNQFKDRFTETPVEPS